MLRMKFFRSIGLVVVSAGVEKDSYDYSKKAFFSGVDYSTCSCNKDNINKPNPIARKH